MSPWHPPVQKIEKLRNFLIGIFQKKKKKGRPSSMRRVPFLLDLYFLINEIANLPSDFTSRKWFFLSAD
jgi:hypothetical protein